MNKNAKIFFSTALILSSLFGALNAADKDKGPMVELEVRSWDANFDSDVRLIKNNIGRTFDVVETLGVEDETITEGVLTFYTGDKNKIRISYFKADYDGSQNVTETVTFLGQSYSVGTKVNTRLDIAYARLGYLFYSGDEGEKFRVGGIVELKAIDFDIALEAPAFPALNKTESVIGALPAVGVSLELRPYEGVLMYAEFSGISDGGTYGHFVEGEAGVKYTMGNFSVSAGYRMFEMKAENDLDFFELEMSGPFFGGHVNF
jgi:hypothetical protein